MRIIGGTHAGLRLNPPTGLPVRPTTDMAKEALFNILNNRMAFDGIAALDLFCGTGNMAFELASRGAAPVTAVDVHAKCLQFVNMTAGKLKLDAITTVRADAMKFLAACKERFELIFADPPYDLPQLPQLPDLVFANGLLKPGGTLILEHSTNRKVNHHPNFDETRQYGYSSFSFFTADA